MFIHLFYIYIKDLLKFLLVYNIAIIIPFNYFACNIIIFLFINTYLVRDFFKELKADSYGIKKLVNTNVV